MEILVKWNLNGLETGWIQARHPWSHGLKTWWPSVTFTFKEIPRVLDWSSLPMMSIFVLPCASQLISSLSHKSLHKRLTNRLTICVCGVSAFVGTRLALNPWTLTPTRLTMICFHFAIAVSTGAMSMPKRHLHRASPRRPRKYPKQRRNHLRCLKENKKAHLRDNQHY